MGTVPAFLVVGGANVDIQGTPHAAMRPGDSNPGTIVLSAGGVGRNIAENLSKLGGRVAFVTALGEDSLSHIVEESLSASGIDARHAIRMAGGRSPAYVSLFHRDGRLAEAVADMSLIEELSGERLAVAAVAAAAAHSSADSRSADAAGNAAVCILDANLSTSALRAVSQALRPLMTLVDPVSVAKAHRVVESGILASLDAIKCNTGELAVLSGRQVQSDTEIAAAIDVLHRAGPHHIAVSLGARGIVCSAAARVERNEVNSAGTSRVLARTPPRAAVNVSGAGDAQTAALAWALAAAWDLGTAASFIAAAAAITVEADNPVATGFDLTSVTAVAETVRLEPFF